MLKMLPRMMTPGVMLQILQDMIPAYTENGPTGRTSFIRDGITEGQKDVAQEGFNLGHRQSADVGYKWGLVRGITSALASLPDSLKEKLLLDGQRRGKLEDLHNSVQEISAQSALLLFHESTLQDNRRPEESKLQIVTKDLLLLLHECPNVHVSEKLKRVP